MAASFLQNDHKKLSSQKWKLFLSHIRGRYQLSTQNINAQLIDSIAIKSQVDKADVQDIFKQWERLNQLPEISTDQLIAFHKSIEHFYNNAK